MRTQWPFAFLSSHLFSSSRLHHSTPKIGLKGINRRARGYFEQMSTPVSPTASAQSVPLPHAPPATKRHNFCTVLTISFIAEFLCVMSHEVIGHGGTAYLWGERAFHLYSTYIDFDYKGPAIGYRWICADGALFNLLLSAIGWLQLRRPRNDSANTRYFLFLFTAFNLMVAAIYPVYSAIVHGLDWQQVIEGLPHENLLRIFMGIVGAMLYLLFTWYCASELTRFAGNWWTLVLVPYFGTMVLSCLAAYLGPQGMKIVWESAFPAIAVGYAGLPVLPLLAIFQKRKQEPALRVTSGPIFNVVGVLLFLLLCYIGRYSISWKM